MGFKDKFFLLIVVFGLVSFVLEYSWVESATEDLKTDVIVDKLDVPWDMAFLPEGTLLITEKPGYLTAFNTKTKQKERFKIEKVFSMGEAGLLGLAIHPNYAANHWIYLFRTVEKGDQKWNQIVRFHYENNKLTEDKIILDDIPAGIMQNGGKLAFGPDGYLYIGTGDGDRIFLAQDKKTLAGKILRIDDSGNIPDSNPFKNAIYSYGHRNPQGFIWDKEGRLWAADKGTQGQDKFYSILSGKNYGWPNVNPQHQTDHYVGPMLQGKRFEVLDPTGLAIWNNKFYFGGLRSQALFQAEFQPQFKYSRHLQNKLGRIRAVMVGPDQALYISTNNRDNRGGLPQPQDDKILKIIQK